MRISLSGSDWLFKDFYGEDWRWRRAHMPDTRDVRWWRRGGRVPGSVLDDLWRLGEIANPYIERNSLLCEWAPQRTWVYKKQFHVPAIQKPYPRVRLVFEGVDYEAEFFLNGESLGTHRGMFTPAAFEVGDKLRYDAGNLVAVAIAPAPHEEPQIGRTSRVRTHKTRMNYWWDFCPRLVHQGIWDDVYLEFTGPVRIADVFVRPRLNEDLTRADVTVAIELDSTIETETEIEITLRLAEQVVAQTIRRVTVAAGRTQTAADLAVDHPHLWWPNGYGEQTLYECEVRTLSPTPHITEEESRIVRFGIRRIELVPNDTPDTTARPYTFVVNGRRVYINGWNWVPMDALYGVPRPGKLERLLALAQRAHVNLLRVWGGGLIEKEAFYNLCDRLGIMVWQEFILSSSGIDNSPSTDPDYIALLVHEAEQIIPRRRNHPALVLWCGGNELQGRSGMASAPDVERGPEQPLDDRHPALAALKATVERLDPDRLWLPTSPSGRAFGNSLENIERDPLGQHDVHGPWEYQGVDKHYALYNAGTSLFHSEFGVEGITNLKSLNAVISPEHQWPVDLAQNPYWFHLGAWWVRRAMWDQTFGPLSDVASYVRATQFLQAEGLRYAVEADRRRRWRNSGVIPWQFNEPYPMAACTSAVDYWAEPKPAYYAVARAYEPVTVTAAFPTIAWGGREMFEAEVWMNATEAPGALHAAGTLHARLIGASGRVYSGQMLTIAPAADGVARVLKVKCPISDLAEDIFFLDLRLADEAGNDLACNRYAFTRTDNLAVLMAPQPPTTLAVAPIDETGIITIANTGPYTAFFVWLEDARPRRWGNEQSGHVFFDDNYFCLFPGEARRVRIAWEGVVSAERCVAASAWNAKPIVI